MTILFLPFLILFLITAKMIYLYLAGAVLIPILIGPFFEYFFDFVKEVGGSDGLGSLVKWAGVGALVMVVYFMMHT